jgi:hypothetical protein
MSTAEHAPPVKAYLTDRGGGRRIDASSLLHSVLASLPLPVLGQVKRQDARQDQQIIVPALSRRRMFRSG